MKKLAYLLLSLALLLSGCSSSASSSPISIRQPSSISSSVSIPESILRAPSESTSTSSASSEIPEQQALFDVTRVIDGDTIEIDYNGTPEKVRLLLVDTPESVHPDANRNVPYGQTAADFTKSQLDGKQVSLEFDVSERDRYGRLLAYVYVGDTMLNRLLLSKGHAVVSVYQPNVKYVDEFRQLETDAKEKQLGLWAQEAFSESSVSSTAPAAPAPVSLAPAPEAAQEVETMVWIPRTGKKYHSRSSCSNMKNPSEVTLQQAINSGYGKCKKCW